MVLLYMKLININYNVYNNGIFCLELEQWGETMISDTSFSANMTRYINCLERTNNWNKTPVYTLSEAKLLTLFVRNYENTGNFIYGINKYEQWGLAHDKSK